MEIILEFLKILFKFFYKKYEMYNIHRNLKFDFKQIENDVDSNISKFRIGVALKKGKPYLSQTYQGINHKNSHNIKEIWIEILRRKNGENDFKVIKSKFFISLDEFNNGLYVCEFYEENGYDIRVLIGTMNKKRNDKIIAIFNHISHHYVRFD